MIQSLKAPRRPANPFTRDVDAALRRANRKVWREAAKLGHKLAILDNGRVKLVQSRAPRRKKGRHASGVTSEKI
jgi:hypothetical protein